MHYDRLLILILLLVPTATAICTTCNEVLPSSSSSSNSTQHCAGLTSSGNATANRLLLNECLYMQRAATVVGRYPVDGSVHVVREGTKLLGQPWPGAQQPSSHLLYVGPVTTSSLLIVSGADAIVANLWVNGNGRIGALTGSAAVVSLGSGATVSRCHLTGATFPAPYVWQTGATCAWVRTNPATANTALPGPAFADATSRSVSGNSSCTLGTAGCYITLAAACSAPPNQAFALSGPSLPAAVVAAAASGKLREPIIVDDVTRGISWGLAAGGGTAPIGTYVVGGSNFTLTASFVGHALQGLNLCGTSNVLLQGNTLGLTGCDTIVLCGTATNLTLQGNTFCGSGYYCPNNHGARSQHMAGIDDLSTDVVPPAQLGYVPAAGVFGGYPEIRFSGVVVAQNQFHDSCAAWPVGPAFPTCGNGLDLTGVNTLGLKQQGAKLYWGPITFADSGTATCSPMQCVVGRDAGCFATPAACQRSTGFIAPAFADATTRACSPQRCQPGKGDQGCYASLGDCMAGNPSFTDVTTLSFEVSGNTMHKSNATASAHACPVGTPAPPMLCAQCSGAYPIDVWQGYNEHTCTFVNNSIAWDGHTGVYVHYS